MPQPPSLHVQRDITIRAYEGISSLPLNTLRRKMSTVPTTTHIPRVLSIHAQSCISCFGSLQRRLSSRSFPRAALGRGGREIRTNRLFSFDIRSSWGISAYGGVVYLLNRRLSVPSRHGSEFDVSPVQRRVSVIFPSTPAVSQRKGHLFLKIPSDKRVWTLGYASVGGISEKSRPSATSTPRRWVSVCLLQTYLPTRSDS